MRIRLSRRPHLDRRRERSRGQSLVELALVTPLLLLLFAGVADLGRAFHAYVAVENAAKEGALFGSRAPLCDDSSAGTCSDPNNVVWRVRAELREQGIRNPDSSELTPAVACLDASGTPRPLLRDCIEGDTYQVQVSYPFKLLTPILGALVGDINLVSASRAVVLNLAFDPTPGASIQKLVSPTGAVNASEIIAKCTEPDDNDAAGYYRSPCRDTSTADPIDVLTLRFEQGATINYRVRLGNSGVQTLSGVTFADSRGATGCVVPGTMVVGYSQICDYTRTAPNVSGADNSQGYDNVATIDSAQTAPATSGVTVTIERPPARLRVAKFVSPFRLGGDGDGTPTFTVGTLGLTHRAPITTPYAWFRVLVINSGGQTATGVSITDSRGALPFGTTNATAACPAAPATLAAGATWECFYRVSFSSTSPASNPNTITATATNVVPDGDDTATATVTVAACAGTNRPVPDLIGLAKAPAATAWTAAGFSTALDTWGGQNSALVVTQTRTAFACVPATSTMTVTRTTTP